MKRKTLEEVIEDRYKALKAQEKRAVHRGRFTFQLPKHLQEIHEESEIREVLANMTHEDKEKLLKWLDNDLEFSKAYIEWIKAFTKYPNLEAMVLIVQRTINPDVFEIVDSGLRLAFKVRKITKLEYDKLEI